MGAQIFRALDTLPLLDGDIFISGVEYGSISRDKSGVAHIYCDSIDSCWILQGYVHASDRLWQMDMARRLGKGKIAEILGDSTVDVDIFAKTVGWERLANMDLKGIKEREIFKWIECYCKGVNAYIDEKRLSGEFKLLRYEPEKWTVIDTLVIVRVMCFKMQFGWQEKLVRAKLEHAFGKHAKVFDREEFSEYPTARSDVNWENLDFSSALDPEIVGIKQGQGSNSWVLHGSKTQSGLPLFACDPHLPLPVPNSFYEIHMHVQSKENGEDLYHVAGISIPGILGIVMGHNEDIAWGNTLGYCDCGDIFIEKLLKGKDNEYFFEYDDEKQKAEIKQETILIKDKDPVVINVMYSKHGPIISGVLSSFDEGVINQADDLKNSDFDLVISYCGTEIQNFEKNVLEVFSEINFCKNFDSFLRAVQTLEAPSLNFIYADKKGNIGYALGGKVPLRLKNESHSLLPKIGWISDNDWTDFIPSDEMPMLFNPKEGYIVSANHQITDKSYPYHLGDLFRPDYRAQVIHSSLSEEKLFTTKDFEQLQSNLYTLPASILQKILKERNLAFPNDYHLQKLLDEFLNWDCYASLESSGMCIYAAVFLQLVRILFDRESPHEKFSDLILGKGFGIIKPTQAMLCRTHESLFKILNNDNSFFLARCGGFSELMQRSFTQASELLKIKFGNNNIKSYRWGFLHKYSANHPFSKKLGDSINTEPVECPGSEYSVCVSSWEFDGNFTASQTVGVSWKMILDMGSIENGISQLAPGNSGQVGSRFYSNNLKEWANLKYHSFLWTREQVEKDSICKLEISSETKSYCTIS